MTQTKEQPSRTHTLGDDAVDGLLRGTSAGVLMAAYVIVVGWLGGESVASTLGRFDPGHSGGALAGSLAHLATAAVYGALFGAAWHVLQPGRARLPGWLAGLAYSVLLLALANGVLLPWMASALRGVPAVHFFVAHLLYGVTLGWQIGRRLPAEG